MPPSESGSGKAMGQMTDARVLFWGAVASLAVALVVGVCNLIVRWRREDTIAIDSALRLGADLNILQSVGCPCLLLTLTGRSRRPAKIKGAKLCAKGVNLLPVFQRAFGTDFGHPPHPDSQAEDSFSALFLPASPRGSTQGWVLPRDDTIRLHTPTTRATSRQLCPTKRTSTLAIP